jgi:anaerobic selenocysteine-containing dehydrogenase
MNRNNRKPRKVRLSPASWDEALDLIEGKIKRIQTTYGKESVTAITSSHHSWVLVGYKLSAFARFLQKLGYTEIKTTLTPGKVLPGALRIPTVITGASADPKRTTCWRMRCRMSKP